MTAAPAIFGRRLRHERERRNLTLRQLAAKCHVNASTVLRAEQGRDVALSIAVSLAEALGLPLAALLAELECSQCAGSPPSGFICGTCGMTAGAGFVRAYECGTTEPAARSEVNELNRQVSGGGSGI